MTFDAATGESPIWTPSIDRIANANITFWLKTLREQGIVPANIRDTHSLQRWSVENIDLFWAAIWREAGIISDVEFGSATSDGEPWSAVLLNAQYFGSGYA